MKERADAAVAAVVLAAGMSSRMGEAKQLLQVGGATMLEQILGVVRAAGVKHRLLVLGHDAAGIRAKLPEDAFSGFEVVINPEYREGMSTSLRAGLAALAANIEAALVVLADQPLLTAATLDRIIAVYRESGAAIVIPAYRRKRGNPVLVDRSIFPEVNALSEDTGFRGVFAAHASEIVIVDVEDAGVLLDIDEPRQYQRLLDSKD